jgi:FkbM family methyltransferase
MHVLNRILPLSLRMVLRAIALRVVPSMRHLDMNMRLRHMAAIGFSPRVIVDVGAADGAWSRMAARIWPTARIVAFEPRETKRAQLEAARRELPNFSYHICFLGEKAGRVTYADRGNQTSLYTTQATAGESADMRTLDEHVEAGHVPHPDLLKLDVQGYELEVLAGCDRVLRGVQAVLTETSFYKFHPAMPTAGDVIAYMKARGFVVYDVMGLLRLEEDDALGQMDLMFLRSEHPLRGKRSW